MEQAIFISRKGQIGHVNKQFTRLYYGNEFCEHLIPSLDDLTDVAAFARSGSYSLTLVTPYVTNNGLKKVQRILEYGVEHIPDIEIVVNDWGVLRLIKRVNKAVPCLLGRLLTKQKRGPQTVPLNASVPETMTRHFQSCPVDVPWMGDFLRAHGILRVELDNTLQGIVRPLGVLKASLYYPYTYVTTTRYCLSAACEKDKIPLRRIIQCRQECHRYTFKLAHRSMAVDLRLQGNTQFFQNDSLPADFEALQIDRLVYEPEIPL